MKKDFLPIYVVLLSLTTFCILAPSQTNASFPSKGFLLTEEEKKNKASLSEEKKKEPPVKQEKKKEEPFFKGGFFVSKTPVKKIVSTPEKSIEIKEIDEWEKMPAPTLWTVDKLKEYPLYNTFSPLKQKTLKNIFWLIALWDKEKCYQYLKIATNRFIDDYKIQSIRSDMYSFNMLSDLRLSFLYTLDQSKRGLPTLEVGGGLGYMTRNMLVLGAHVTLVDNNPENLEYTEKHLEKYKEFLPSNYKNLSTLECSDINNADASFYKGRYWMVNCEQVLHFIYPKEIHLFLDRIFNALYPGGLLFVNVIPSFETQEDINLYMKGRENKEEFPYPYDVKTSNILIALEELTNVIKNHGFYIEKSFNIDIFGDTTDRTCFIPNPNEKEIVSACVIARRPPEKIIFEPVKKKTELIEKKEEKPFLKGGFFVTPPKMDREIKIEEKKAPSQPFFKGGFFVTKSPLQNPPSKKAPEPIIEIKKVDKWSQMEAPKLWAVDKLKFHPLCWKTNQMNSNALQYTKNVLWFSQLWNDKQKSKKYFDVVMNYQFNKTELSEYVNFETSMPSIIQLNDLRISLLYTLTETKPGIPVLDLGGGFGFSALNMLILKANVTLVDKSQESLKQAKLHFEKHKEFLPENYTDLCTLEKSDFTDGNAPFYRQKYWIVNCEQILDFLLPDQINILLGRIYDVLHPGGLFFTSIITAFFNQEDINEYNEYVERYKKGKEFSIEKKFKLQSTLSGHLIFKLSNELANIIQKHGFIIEDSFNMDIMGNKLKNPFISTPEIGMTTKVGIIARKPFNTEKK